MNKTELIKKASAKQGVTQKDMSAALEALIGTIIEEVSEGGEVNISGFGKFSSVDVAERTGIIQMGDRKGETYTTLAHKAPKFKFASAFKEAVK